MGTKKAAKKSPKKKSSPKKAKAKKGGGKKKKAKKKAKKKKKKKKKKAKKKKKRKKASKGLFAPKTLSKELAAVCGGNRMARPAAVKGIWKYIKGHKCNAGRTIKPDATLAKVCGSASFSMFKLPGMMSKHLK